MSATYYALFHLLLTDAANQLARGRALRNLVRRAFTHAEMKKVARTYASGGNLPEHVEAIKQQEVPPVIRQISKLFLFLQERRHEADYDLNAKFSRAQVVELITKTEGAFADWKALRADPEARLAVELFLTALLLWDRWGR